MRALYDFTRGLLRRDGSVFPQAFATALPCSLITGALVLSIHHFKFLGEFKEEDDVMRNSAVWGSFSSLVGFVVVFRTSQAYNRFWEGVSATHRMGAAWYDCCAGLIAFTRAAEAAEAETLEFQNKVVRLFSMLHAAALSEIEDCGESDQSTALDLPLIDPSSVDFETLRVIKDSQAKTELIFQWIQQLIIVSIRTRVMSIPPPILTRSFQEIADGMKHFHDARKVSMVPFPFPYEQTCDCLLLIHWLLVPCVTAAWVEDVWWAMIFSSAQVFTMWSLNYIAVELQNPFGNDSNDIDFWQMQTAMNHSLAQLVAPEQLRIPELVPRRKTRRKEFQRQGSIQRESIQRIARVGSDGSDQHNVSYQSIWTSLTAELENYTYSVDGEEKDCPSASGEIRAQLPDFSEFSGGATKNRGNREMDQPMSETGKVQEKKEEHAAPGKFSPFRGLGTRSLGIDEEKDCRLATVTPPEKLHSHSGETRAPLSDLREFSGSFRRVVSVDEERGGDIEADMGGSDDEAAIPLEVRVFASPDVRDLAPPASPSGRSSQRSRIR